MSKGRSIAEGAALPIVLLLAWEVAAWFGSVPRYLASPSAIALAAGKLFASGELLPAILVSLWRVYAGYAVGAGLGMVIGLCAGLVRPVRDFFDPLASFFYPVPKIAFLPVFLLLFGLGDGSKIAVIGLSVFFPVFIAARHSVVEVDRQLVWCARNMGAGPVRIFFRVILPAVRPQLFVGARVGLALSFVLLFAAELIGSRDGLGKLVHEGEEALRFDLMLAAILAFAVLGFLSDAILMAVRTRVLRGQLLGTEEQAR